MSSLAGEGRFTAPYVRSNKRTELQQNYDEGYAAINQYLAKTTSNSAHEIHVKNDSQQRRKQLQGQPLLFDPSVILLYSFVAPESTISPSSCLTEWQVRIVRNIVVENCNTKPIGKIPTRFVEIKFRSKQSTDFLP